MLQSPALYPRNLVFYPKKRYARQFGPIFARFIFHITIHLMKNLKKIYLFALLVGAMSLTGCLNILEEVTFKKNGSGTYSMIIDMSEMKNMMDMFKTMAPGQEGTTTPTEEGTEKDMNSEDVQGKEDGSNDAAAEENPADMSKMGEQLTGGVAKSLEGVAGITNVVEVNDTAAFKFGYTFEFANVEALNKAIKIINKEKYDAKAEETFKVSGKKFERLGTANIGEELKKALSEGDEDGQMDMMKSFFADMAYTQVYRFPDRTVKKSTNELSEVTEEGHTLTIKIKPFSEEEKMKKATVATEAKLK